MKLGRQPRIYNSAIPHYSALRMATKPILLPVEIDYSKGMPDNLGFMLNDTLGDCTCAAYYHALQVWSFHCNPDKKIITQPNNNVLSLYKETCGYNPVDPSTDQGGIEQNVLSYLFNTGAITGLHGETRHKLRAFVEIDTRNIQDIKQAIYKCGIVYIGFNVPENIMVSPSPTIWEIIPNSQTEGGHAVILTGYDTQGFNLISWGFKYKMTYDFFLKYCDEAYALVDINWFEATGKTLLGLSIQDLKIQMSYLKKYK